MRGCKHSLANNLVEKKTFNHLRPQKVISAPLAPTVIVPHRCVVSSDPVPQTTVGSFPVTTLKITDHHGSIRPQGRNSRFRNRKLTTFWLFLWETQFVLTHCMSFWTEESGAVLCLKTPWSPRSPWPLGKTGPKSHTFGTARGPPPLSPDQQIDKAPAGNETPARCLNMYGIWEQSSGSPGNECRISVAPPSQWHPRQSQTSQQQPFLMSNVCKQKERHNSKPAASMMTTDKCGEHTETVAHTNCIQQQWTTTVRDSRCPPMCLTRTTLRVLTPETFLETDAALQGRGGNGPQQKPHEY